MLSLLLVILLVVIFFKITGFIFHIIGTLLGWIFGGIGWLILAGLAVMVFGLAIFAVPVILIVGIVALISAAAD